MSTIHEIQAWAAPVLAPAAPATLLANSMYLGMTADGVTNAVALSVAVGAAIGTEFTGAIAARAGVEAYRKRKPVHMWLAIGASLIYALFVIYGISSVEHSQAFAGSVFISLIAYLGVAIYNDLREDEAEKAREDEREIAKTKAQVDLINAEKNRQNAMNRGAKLSTLSNGQNGQVGQAAEYFDPDKIAWMTDYLKRNEGQKISTVDIVGEPGCPFTSRQTANKYRAEAERRK